MYHMHALVARRRREVLRQSLAKQRARLDGLIMWGSWFNPRLDGVPVVHYIDQSLALEPALGEPRPQYLNRRAAHRQQARTYREAAGIVCYSKWGREQTLLAHPTLDPAKVRAVGWGPCAVDLSSEKPNWDAREPLVLHVSNDFHRKGLDFLVETATRVRRIVPNATFVVIGGDYGGMKHVPQAPGVTFTGRIADRAILEDYFRRASVFFLPHRFDRSPHVLVEAMSAGLPLVTSAQGGPEELAGNTGAGFTIPIGDVDGYTNAVTMLLQNREMATRMGEVGRQLMLRSYNWDAVAANILEVLKSAQAKALA
jgi:glycosyltransferase involved in cell wall biosynthesis